MMFAVQPRGRRFRPAAVSSLPLAAALFWAAGAALPSGAHAQVTQSGMMPAAASHPDPDPRVGLRGGLMNAAEATWNLKVVSKTPPPKEFIGSTNSDLAFTGHYAIQGNYNGYQVWDISDPAHPQLAKGFVCPASQSDVSVYHNLLFVSGEGMGGRLDCGTEGVKEAVSHDRLRGIRIFDITDIQNPKYIANVQTCRGSHTHTVVADPRDRENVYVYVSGSAPVRPADELPGCVSAPPGQDPNSALFRIEVIKVPLAHPERAAIVSSPRIFNDLTAPATHGLAPDDKAEIEAAKAKGKYIAEVMGQTFVLPDQFANRMLDSIMKARGGTGAPTGEDSVTLRRELPSMIARMVGSRPDQGNGPRPGPTQCHDITVYPEIGLAGGACEGYGLLLDISDVVNPRRIAAVSDSNFSYWHSATFNNDGTKLLFSDEWGGGGAPKCRATDPKEWGADAIFTVVDRRELKFGSYYKLPAPQTVEENCVAHNGSIIPVPGRDVMVQAWYQGGISVFDFTDASHPVEIAFFDRGPADSTQMAMGGSWSAYWYNGVIVSSEIARGLDIFELAPSDYLSANEIAAAKSVQVDYLNTQGQPHYSWPATFTLAGAYLDQLERSRGLPANRISAVRKQLQEAEHASGSTRKTQLNRIAAALDQDAGKAGAAAKVRQLAETLRNIGAAAP